MWNAGLDEAQTGIKIASRNINNLGYADDTTLIGESEEEIKSLLMKEKEESEKTGLKLNIQKTNIMTSGSIQFSSVAQSCPILCDPMNHSMPGLPVHHQLLEFTQTHAHWVSDAITSWQIDGETMETVTDFIFLGSKITADGDCSHELKETYSLGEKLWPTFSSVQWLSHVWLFVTPWNAACQASLSITTSQSLLRLMSIKLVMPSNHLILCRPLLLLPLIFPSIRVFSNESVLRSGGQSIGVSASSSVLPINIQDWSPLGWTGWISLQSKGCSRVFSNTTVQKHQFFSSQFSF